MRSMPEPCSGGVLRFGKRNAKFNARDLTFATSRAPSVLPSEYGFGVVHKPPMRSGLTAKRP